MRFLGRWEGREGVRRRGGLGLCLLHRPVSERFVRFRAMPSGFIVQSKNSSFVLESRSAGFIVQSMNSLFGLESRSAGIIVQSMSSLFVLESRSAGFIVQ